MISDCPDLRIGLCDFKLFSKTVDHFLADDKWKTVLVYDADPGDRVVILDKKKAGSPKKADEEARNKKRKKSDPPIPSKFCIVLALALDWNCIGMVSKYVIVKDRNYIELLKLHNYIV